MAIYRDLHRHILKVGRNMAVHAPTASQYGWSKKNKWQVAKAKERSRLVMTIFQAWLRILVFILRAEGRKSNNSRFVFKNDL